MGGAWGPFCWSRRTGGVQMFTLQGALVALKGTSWCLISTIWTRYGTQGIDKPEVMFQVLYGALWASIASDGTMGTMRC